MTRRRTLLLAIAAIVALTCCSGLESKLVGWRHGEASYQGRYTNSWRAELRQYEPVMAVNFDRLHWLYLREPPAWQWQLAKILPSVFAGAGTYTNPPLQRGDPEAVPVLVELLRAPEKNVRMLAADGLSEVGPRARDAVPALLDALNDEEEEVCQNAATALLAIDPDAVAGMKHPRAWLPTFGDPEPSP